MSSEPSIRIRKLGKCYQIYAKPRDRLLQMLFGKAKTYYTEHWALQPFDLDIQPGEAIGVIGTNGSGKSTLLQLIAGTLSPTLGRVAVNGRVAALLELGAGFNPEFTGRENVQLAASLYGLTDAEINARFQDITDFAEIGEYIDQPVKTYSSGMYVRLAFAVIAHVNADILIVDEALAVGDALFTQKCMRFIRNFKNNGTLIFVSHDLHSVRSLCTKAIWLNQGKLESIGDAKTVCDSYLTRLFGGSNKQNIAPLEQSQTKQSQQKTINWRDARQDFINHSNIRNDIRIFDFDATGTDYVGNDAEIFEVQLVDEQSNPLLWCIGGEKVVLRIRARIHKNLQSPIVGFYLRDRLGQTVFGDNTFLTYANNPQAQDQGSEITTEFEFHMPWLAKGDYVFSVAIAEGTQESHRQLHWIHDALVLSSQTSPLATGLIGIPMQRIEMNRH